MTFTDDTTGIILINWPARSPDINPTEHTWVILSRRFRQQPHPYNVQNLIDALVQELQAIPLKGIMSTTRCCQDKGGQASYWLNNVLTLIDELTMQRSHMF